MLNDDIHGNGDDVRIDNITNCTSVHDHLGLSCIALNVGGYGSKSTYPDLEEFISQHDIVCISESKLSDTDTVNIQGFTSFYKNRKNYLRKSGGLLVLVRDCYVKNIKIYEHVSVRDRAGSWRGSMEPLSGAIVTLMPWCPF